MEQLPEIHQKKEKPTFEEILPLPQEANDKDESQINLVRPETYKQ